MSEQRWTVGQRDVARDAARNIWGAAAALDSTDALDVLCEQLEKCAPAFDRAARAESDALRSELAEAKRAAAPPKGFRSWAQYWDGQRGMVERHSDEIARAVAAEREACAKIADEVTDEISTPHFRETYGQRVGWVSDLVGLHIRSRTPAPAGGAQGTEHAAQEEATRSSPLLAQQRQTPTVSTNAEGAAPNQAAESAEHAGAQSAQSSPSEDECQRQGVQAESSAQAPAPDKPLHSDYDISYRSPLPPPLTEARVREIVLALPCFKAQGEMNAFIKRRFFDLEVRAAALESKSHEPQDGLCKAEDVERRLRHVHARLSALESQQETARGEKTDKADAAGEPSTASTNDPASAPPSPQPNSSERPKGKMTEEELGLAILRAAWIGSNIAMFVSPVIVAREARRLIAQELPVSIAREVEERERFRELWHGAKTDRDEAVRGMNENADKIVELAQAVRGLKVERDTLRSRVAELEVRNWNARKQRIPEMANIDIEGIVKWLCARSNTPGAAMSDVEAAIRTKLAKYVPHARPARRITAEDMEAAREAYVRAGEPRQWSEFYAQSLNDLLSSRGDDKPQGAATEGGK